MRLHAALCIAALALSLPLAASAEPVWVGDLETNDFSQWDGQLNGQNITITQDPVAQGSYAAQIQLTNDATWPNGLKRVELHHSPSAGRTAEGEELYFAWSFYLPETLPTDPSQQIGYWESDQSYQQLMAFNVRGETIEFITQRPSYTVHWTGDGLVTPGVWHRVAMHIVWSQEQALGRVDVWFDGVQVVTQAPAETLADDNEAFTQIGLLRGAIEFSDAPYIILDDAVEGETLADVRPELSTGEGGGGAGVGGGEPVGGSAAGGAGSGAAPGEGGSLATGGNGGAASGDGGESGGCDCGTSPAATRGAPWGLALVAALALRTRRRH